MKQEIREMAGVGRVLFLTDGNTQVGVALDIGIRVVHLSRCGMENLYYRQPADGSDGLATADGWQIYGGHRLWISPEGDQTYYPDNDPVRYTVTEEEATFFQPVDRWLQIEKSLTLAFLPDGRIQVTHRITNVGDAPFCGAIWGVNTLDGGKGEVDFTGDPPDSCFPHRTMALWGQTDLGDERIRFSSDRIYATHISGKKEYFKIGVFSQQGRLRYENKGQCLDIAFPSYAGEPLPDNGCNAELFMNATIMELETLAPTVTLQTGESATASEIWSVTKQ